MGTQSVRFGDFALFGLCKKTDVDWWSSAAAVSDNLRTLLFLIRNVLGRSWTRDPMVLPRLNLVGGHASVCDGERVWFSDIEEVYDVMEDV